jgi:ketosteroid isomerase-like protein
MNDALTRDEMVAHARAWIAAWNARDLQAVLDAYADDACFRSPVARAVTGSSFLQGKAAMKAYWRTGLARLPNLRFTLTSVICDVEAQMMVVHYDAALDGPPKRACEIFRFENGKKTYGEALYGDQA